MRPALQIALLLALAGRISAAEPVQTTSGDCSPALAYISGFVEIHCELGSRDLTRLAAEVSEFQAQGRANALEIERLVEQINNMLAAVSQAREEFTGRIGRQDVDIAELTKLISSSLMNDSGEAATALERTRAWPGEFESLRREWSAADPQGRFVEAYDSFVRGGLARTEETLEEYVAASNADAETVALANYLLGRVKELQFRTPAALANFEVAWNLAPSNVDYRLKHAEVLVSRSAFEDAAEQYGIAIEDLRPLAMKPDSSRRPQLASALRDLAFVHLELDQEYAAEAAYSESRDLYETLSKEDPEAFAPDFAASLSELALIYGDARRFREAEATLTSADAAYRRLVGQDRWRFLPDLVRNLISLADLHVVLERYVEAGADLDEAEHHARELAERDPVVFGMLLASVMYRRGEWWGDNDGKAAIEAFDAARKALEPPMLSDPSAHEADYAQVLQALARAKWEAGYYPDFEGPLVVEALADLRDARDIWRRRVKINPQAFEPKLLRVLRDLGHIQFFTDDFEGADGALQEALRLARSNPDLHGQHIENIEEAIADLHRVNDHRRAKERN